MLSHFAQRIDVLPGSPRVQWVFTQAVHTVHSILVHAQLPQSGHLTDDVAQKLKPTMYTLIHTEQH